MVYGMKDYLILHWKVRFNHLVERNYIQEFRQKQQDYVMDL